MLDRSARARTDASGRQVIDVTVDGRYIPDLIYARSGLPLRIAFHREDASDCAERVVFSAPRIERHLALRETTIVDLPAQAAGEVRFTCGMGRYVGRVDIADARSSLAARLRERAGQLETPLGTALVLWICSLPLIALVAVLVLDAAAAFAVAGAALIAWVVGCLWAFGRHQWRLDRR